MNDERTRAAEDAIHAAERSDARDETPDLDVRRAARGDVRAFERLYRDHVALVFSLARRMAGPDEAEELTQEVFVRAWQKLKTFRGDAAFSTWLHRVAVNLILTRRRSRKRLEEREVENDGALESAAAPPQTPGAALDLETALDALPAGARQVFVLHDVEGYRHDEIADMLGVSAGTSKSQLHRARMLMRAQLVG